MGTNPRGNVVITGDKVYAGIEEDDQSEVSNAIVIEFETQEEFNAAISSGQASFTIFDGN
ncbi:MAG: hypothetical protein KZQ73_00250 [Candidatus Thiodiazotropha sp. (ex Semelilucina semeliformis)]|nr:hypothetical protein [Candidatus Thiodiazotropha sp. (ex Semelilucina semeliformis)]